MEEGARFRDIEIHGGRAVACLLWANGLRERAPHAHHLHRPSVLREAEGWEAEAEECDASMCEVRAMLVPEEFVTMMRATGVAPMMELIHRTEITRTTM